MSAYLPPAVKPLAPPLREPKYADVPFAEVPFADGTHRTLRLDVYQHPSQTAPGPCVVYFFGGGWSEGDYKQRTSQKAVYIRDLVELVDRGLTVVSASYRLVHEAPFPACVHDAKGLIRFLKAEGPRFGIDPARIGVLGNSAGGHLSAMIALSSGIAEIEGDVGGRTEHRSDVAACVIYYAPADLPRMSGSPAGDVRGTEVEGVIDAAGEDGIARILGWDAAARGTTLAEAWAADPIGHDARAFAEVLRRYSPRTYAHADAPPMLLLHGGRDALVPARESEDLYGALRDAGADATYLTYSLGAHGPSLGPGVDAFAYEFLLSRL